jgi:hypothetical protein
MYPTAEVRWFFKGPVPRGVEAWFQRRMGSSEREPPRVDRYLRLPDSESLNVKLREGRIEIKQRVGQASVVRFHEHVTGRVEIWHKWSFELARSDVHASHTVYPASSWIAVRKERWLRTYQVEGNKDYGGQSAAEPPAQGCELELTTVRVAGQTWWTLAFEAFGEESPLEEILLSVARHIFDIDEPPLLPVGQSRGYAAWLVAITQKER